MRELYQLFVQQLEEGQPVTFDVEAGQPVLKQLTL